MTGAGDRVLIIGLDAAPPRLVFQDLLPDLPNIGRLMAGGLHGPLRSCHPPITIPAWMVAATGKDPGRLGLYGFRHRRGYSYSDIWVANSGSIREPALWDIIAQAGKRVCLVGVPPSYPPRPVAGWLISCFLTPDADREYTYPSELRQEVEAQTGDYIFDVEFRSEERDRTLAQLYQMTERRFRAVKHLLASKEWDFAMVVEIGIDRVQHAFWKFCDSNHPRYVPSHRYQYVVRDYYRFVDEKLGDLLQVVGDDTAVIVMSDHGAKAMKGCFCINQWLVEEGYLVLKEQPEGITPLAGAAVDWPRTRAWAWGGYYARIFLNVEGREPAGVIKPDEYEDTRDALAEKLRAIRGPAGEALDNRVYAPEELYPECRGEPADLMVYLDDLGWRAAGTIGHDSLYLAENDTGPDDAVHDYDGIFIMHDPRSSAPGAVSGLSLLDIAPTALSRLGLAVTPDMEGRSLV